MTEDDGRPTGPPGPAPTGPAGPRPAGPATPRPKEGDEAILAGIDHTLLSLLAMAATGPARRDVTASVTQTRAAAVLLFRLRMARDAVAALADAYGIDLPARQDHPGHRGASPAAATTGGPGPRPPADTGAGATPAQAAADSAAAARISRGSVVDPTAGAGSAGGGSRRHPAPGATQKFTAGLARYGLGRRCVGKTVDDGRPAACGSADLHGMHRIPAVTTL